MSSRRELHLFDFDGTITSRDSLLDFGQFAVGKRRSQMYFAMVMPMLLLMKMRIVSNGNSKQKFLELHFKGKTEAEMKLLADQYLHHSLKSGLMHPAALEKIGQLRKEEAEICIVSASLDTWLRPFADHLHMGLICTKGKYENGLFVGIDGHNCNYGYKAKMVKQRYNLYDYGKVVAYGDSAGDDALFSIADERHFKPFE